MLLSLRSLLERLSEQEDLENDEVIVSRATLLNGHLAGLFR
jgi:hypothetical protein